VTDGRLRIESRSTDPSPPMDIVVTDPDGNAETMTLHQDCPVALSGLRFAFSICCSNSPARRSARIRIIRAWRSA
jgi:hypothetical protein